MNSQGWALREVAPELTRRYVAEGWWTDERLGDVLAAGLDRHRRLTFRARSDVRPWTGTLGDVAALARSVAGGLQARGIGAGDVGSDVTGALRGAPEARVSKETASAGACASSTPTMATVSNAGSAGRSSSSIAK